VVGASTDAAVPTAPIDPIHFYLVGDTIAIEETKTAYNINTHFIRGIDIMSRVVRDLTGESRARYGGGGAAAAAAAAAAGGAAPGAAPGSGSPAPAGGARPGGGGFGRGGGGGGRSWGAIAAGR